MTKLIDSSTCSDWLTNHHCTCPVCRYELQTDNPVYEAGRVERMKARKPRFAMYELKRMSVTELLALNRRPAPGIVDKDDLIDLLVREERIEIIPSPEPVEYDFDTLKRMRISELKRTMEDAGVFFHAKDVVEKSDMLTIFLNSGRLNLLPTESKPAATTDDSTSQGAISSSNSEGNRSSSSAKRPYVETVEEDSDSEPELKKSGKRYFSPTVEMFGASPSSTSDKNESSDCLPKDTSPDSEILESNQADSEGMLDTSMGENDSMSGVESYPVDGQTPCSSGIDGAESSSESLDHAPGTNQVCDMSPGQTAEDQHESSQPTTTYSVHETCPFQAYTVSHLRDLARVNNIDVSSCFERSDIVRLLTNASIEMKHPSEILRENLSNFGIAELRMIASEVNVDLSQCSDKEDVLHCLVEESTIGRPYLQKYLRALSPLSKLSLAQLKQTARDWGVNINDCLERGEIMQRLITSGRTTRSS